MICEGDLQERKLKARDNGLGINVGFTTAVSKTSEQKQMIAWLVLTAWVGGFRSVQFVYKKSRDDRREERLDVNVNWGPWAWWGSRTAGGFCRSDHRRHPAAPD